MKPLRGKRTELGESVVVIQPAFARRCTWRRWSATTARPVARSPSARWPPVRGRCYRPSRRRQTGAEHSANDLDCGRRVVLSRAASTLRSVETHRRAESSHKKPVRPVFWGSSAESPQDVALLCSPTGDLLARTWCLGHAFFYKCPPPV